MIVESLSSRNATVPLFDGVEITSDTLTGRGGLVLFSRYVRNLELFGDIDRLFGSMRKSSKGLPVTVLFHQLFCFFLDGTSRHLVRFDELKRDDGYAAAIETLPDQMASSHASSASWDPSRGTGCGFSVACYSTCSCGGSSSKRHPS